MKKLLAIAFATAIVGAAIGSGASAAVTPPPCKSHSHIVCRL